MKSDITPDKKNEIYTAMLMERLCKIRQIIAEQGEDSFYISFSGGKDSTVLHHLIDEALPDNRIPRVYANTGIEYNEIVKFVKSLAEKDERFQIIEPSVPIKQMLEKEGYPFKSKKHSKVVDYYQKYGENSKAMRVYLGMELPRSRKIVINENLCPKMLRYQFSPNFKIRISHKCCVEMKEKPLDKWEKQNLKKYSIIGLMREEGGGRSYAQCLVFKDGKFKVFQPLAPLTKDWEDWYIERNHIELCKLYYPPYNFTRTGCKGCPFNITLQKELDTIDKYFPKERAQCERIWQPVYEEYRRIGYRKMRPLDEGRQMTIEELIPEEEAQEKAKKEAK